MRAIRPVVAVTLLVLLIALLIGSAYVVLYVGPARDRAVAARATQEVTGRAMVYQAFRLGQTQAQEHCLADADKDGVPEYLSIDELLRWDMIPNAETVRTQPSGELAHGVYLYAIHLPDGAGGSTTGTPSATPAAIDARERHFVAYGWPLAGFSATLAFAVDERGVLYSCVPVPGSPMPAWNSLYGSGTWGAEPAPPWQPYRKKQ